MERTIEQIKDDTLVFRSKQITLLTELLVNTIDPKVKTQLRILNTIYTVWYDYPNECWVIALPNGHITDTSFKAGIVDCIFANELEG